MSTIKEEISKRRTFAIISHPDAGKTTLTEKFLLFGGAIQTAGAVKNNKITKTAASDFMEIERQRGISVATSVMAFHYKGMLINLLDTPGHRDFAEDTYRTLTAVDSVILVIDCVKGVEAQTERLMEVCRMRKTPVIVFVNKMDRTGADFLTVVDQVKSRLGATPVPIGWHCCASVATFDSPWTREMQTRDRRVALHSAPQGAFVVERSTGHCRCVHLLVAAV